MHDCSRESICLLKVEACVRAYAPCLKTEEKKEKRYTHGTYLRSKNDRAVTAGMCEAYTHRGHVASGSAILKITILALTLPPYNGNAIRWCTVRRPYRLFFSPLFSFLSFRRATIKRSNRLKVEGSTGTWQMFCTIRSKDVSGSYIYIRFFEKGRRCFELDVKCLLRCISEVTARPHRVTVCI